MIAPPAAREKGPIDRHLDHVSVQQREEIDILTAMFFIGEGMSFAKVESLMFIALVTKLRTGYARHRDARCLIPTRKRVAGSLFKEVYSRVSDMVASKERQSSGLISLCFDGSTIVRKHCLNILGNLVEGVDIFKECLSTGEDRVTGEYMAHVMINQVVSVGVEKLCSIASDNTSAVAKARPLVCEMFPQLIDVGDGPHCVDLLIDDIVHGIGEFDRALKNCRSIISFVKSHCYVDALHQNIRAELGLPTAMDFFPETRFSYVGSMILEILRAKRALDLMVAIERRRGGTAQWPRLTRLQQSSFFDLVRNPSTWDGFAAVMKYAKPLSFLTHKLASNSVRFSDVLPLAVATLSQIESIQS